MTRRIHALLPLAMAALLAGGCGGEASGNEEGTAAPSVAVIDLDKIAEGAGKQQEIRDRLEDLRARLREEARKRLDPLRQDLRELEHRMGENPTDQQRQQRERLGQAMQANAGRLELQARQLMRQRRQQLYRAFARQVKPIAKRVAREHGMTVVLTDGVVVVWDDAADLTDEVLEAVKGEDLGPLQLETQPAD